MQGEFNEGNAARSGAFSLRFRGSRMSYGELTGLLYDKEFPGSLTPAETAPAEGGAGASPDSMWMRMSTFGRWTAC
jgi:hypothetical protein